MDRAETGLPDEVDTYDQRVYDKASKNLQDMLESNILMQDKRQKATMSMN